MLPDDSHDVAILRDLAAAVAEIAAQPIQNERRDLWRRHNSLQRTRPLVFVRAFAQHEILGDEALQCRDTFYRPFERFLREMILRDRIGDDYIVEPWITVGAVYSGPTGLRRWGPEIRHKPSPEKGGSYMFDPPIKDEADLDKLVAPRHTIDHVATAAVLNRLGEAIGDLLTVNLDRGPLLREWSADISTDLAQLHGLEQLMWDMLDRPQWLHRFCAFLRDGVLAAHAQAENAGDWTLCNHQNQAMPYAEELSDPQPNSPPVRRKQLWVFMAAQEMAQVSPAMHEEFVLQYQLPILAQFGLSAYGCCEDLTRKIPILRKIPNLRRIAVTPWADVAACAEQIGTDYVLSWRPSPAEMICRGLDEAKVRRVVRDAMDKSRGCHVDVTLKDVQTIQNRFDNVPRWVRIVRDVTDDYT